MALLGVTGQDVKEKQTKCRLRQRASGKGRTSTVTLRLRSTHFPSSQHCQVCAPIGSGPSADAMYEMLR